MRQNLTTDTVERYIDASPDLLYDIVSDVTRTPELSPEVRSCVLSFAGRDVVPVRDGGSAGL